MPKRRHTDVVIDTVMARIESGQLLPGGEIGEAELAESCAVSRTPVREALIQLEAVGMVVRHPRKGVRLFKPDTDAFLEILEVHANLEAQAAALAAQRISPAQAERLRDRSGACSAFAKSPERADHAQYYQLNMLYHAEIAAASCNAHLVEMIKLNARKLMAHYRLRYRAPEAITRSALEHETITQLILSGDAAGAHTAMMAHFNYERETVMHMIASVG